jgi:hypothetical protein
MDSVWGGPFLDAPDDAGGGSAAAAAAAAGEGGKQAEPGKGAGRNAGEADLLGLDKGAGDAGGAGEPAGQDAGEADLLGLDEDADAGKDGIPELLTAEGLTLPEGFEFDGELGKSFLDVLNDAKLGRKELAEKMIGLHAAAMDKLADHVMAERKRRTHEWAAEAKKDAEYGGGRFDANMPVIRRGLDALASPQTRAALKELGIAAHPEVLRVFYRAGKLLGEDSSLGPVGRGTGPMTTDDRAYAMFGDSLEGVRRGHADAEDFVSDSHNLL